jgi:hypothetical protein
MASTHSGQPSPRLDRYSSCRKRGTEGQSRLQLPADGLDPDAVIVVEQSGAVQDGEHADVLGPAEIVCPQHEEVLGGQVSAVVDSHAPLAPTRYWRLPSLMSSQEISGWAARGGQTCDPYSSSRDAFLDRYAARDLDGTTREPSNDAGQRYRQDRGTTRPV